MMRMETWLGSARFGGLCLILGLSLFGSACASKVQAPAGEPGSDAAAALGDAEGESSPVDLDRAPVDAPNELRPDDPRIFVGAYAMSSRGANSQIERLLELNGNMQATLSTRYVDKSPVPIVQTGTWELSGALERPTAIVALTDKDGVPMDGADVITFEMVGDGVLEAMIYNLDLYGSEGLSFVRAD
jgi:hypothetical protein